MTQKTHDIIYTLGDEPSTISFETLFGNSRPVELEIGSGKGGFLLNQALANSQRNYLGVEWASKFFRFAADRMARWGLTNVRVCRTDARAMVIDRVPSRSLAAIHILHPDPWPKKRHHKRRLFSPEFVSAVARVLVDGGLLVVQTDHHEYFMHIAEVLDACSDLERTPAEEHNGWEESSFEATNFQVKYEREGRSFYRRVYVRPPR